MDTNIILVTASFLTEHSDTNAGDVLLQHISSIENLCERVGTMPELDQVYWMAAYWKNQLNAADLNGASISNLPSMGITTIESYIAFIGKGLVAVVSEYSLPKLGITIPT